MPSLVLLLLTVLLRKLRRRPPPPPSSSPHRYSYTFLRRATSSFSGENLLGHGASSAVYLGACSPPLAVKVLETKSPHEFNSELSLASKLQSPHLLKLLGFCSVPRKNRMLLVYELMPNGNLQDALLVKKAEALKPWDARFGVAVDVAKGIEYLHGLDPKVVHGDVKPSNVLLDGEFKAKVGDFGLARMVEGDAYESECECETESVVTTTTTVVDDAFTSPEIEGSVVVKDYVMEWIGSEVKERPEGCDNVRRRLDWWISMDDEVTRKKLRKEKRRTVREWWKDDFGELKKKKKKKKKKKEEIGFCSDDDIKGEDWYTERKKKSRNRSRSSRGSVDWWLDGLSGELWKARGNSYDSTSGEIPKSGGVSSTPSMRGTVCYVAPEYGGGAGLSEKCDVYSYGVLLLVLISGRRPLQVTGSPLTEFHRANLISWARHLARKNKLLDLVDKSIVSLDPEKALLCITIALNCLQKPPASRPSMKEVVGMLTGQLEPPQLPFELSPSPPSCYKNKSQKKVRLYV